MTGYGARGRLGLVVPSTNVTAEPEIGWLLPAGVTAYATRILQPDTADPAREEAAVLAVRSGFGRAVDELASLDPAAIGVACTSTGYLNGAVDDRETCAVLSVRAGRPVLTGSRATVLALRALGVTRVALATPDQDALTAREVDYLAEEGVRTVGSAGPAVVGAGAKGRLPAEQVRDAAMRAYVPEAEAVVLSGAEWRTAGCLAELERRLGVPVLSTNAATAWALLRRAGVDDPLPALGRLGALPG